MDDTQKRIGLLETAVAEIRAILPFLATKEDLNLLRADMYSMETRILRWMIGTAIACATLAFSIAKLIH